MRSVSINYKFVGLLLIILLVGTFIIEYSRAVLLEIQKFDTNISERAQLPLIDKPPAIFAKGLYLTASSAGSKRKREAIIDLILKTELNAVVIDIKDFSGHILYDSRLPLVNELDTDREILKNVRQIIKEFKDNGIYVIARQTVFQDPALARAKPKWAIKGLQDSVWRDYKGLSWVDPTKKEVWDYNLDIAREAAALGFDEINFDYVRFPSDGDISSAVYENMQESKEKIMESFFTYMEQRMRTRPVYTSVDLFGLVTALHDFDLNIGQKLELAVNHADYIYPMMYPSHYPPGYLRFANPADHPFAVVHDGLEKAQIIMEGGTSKLRPWLQAFNLGAVYDAEKIRAQITAAEASANVAGWMIWNASNNYTTQGLKPK